jgi:hypothetical protein
MKSLPAILLFAFSFATFAQTAPTQTATAPGCGTLDTKFDVKTNSSQHPFAKPDAGKALFYFLQDDTNYFSRPRPTTRFGLDGIWIGATQANSYFYVPVDPGEHHLCAGWQSFVGFTGGQKSGALRFTAVEGGMYFFIVRNHSIESMGQPGMKFLPVDSDEAQLLMSKLAFSTSRPKK